MKNRNTNRITTVEITLLCFLKKTIHTSHTSPCRPRQPNDFNWDLIAAKIHIFSEKRLKDTEPQLCFLQDQTVRSPTQWNEWCYSWLKMFPTFSYKFLCATCWISSFLYIKLCNRLHYLCSSWTGSQDTMCRSATYYSYINHHQEKNAVAF